MEESQSKLIEELFQKIDLGTPVTFQEVFNKFFPENLFDGFHKSVSNDFIIPVSGAFKGFYTKLQDKLNKIIETEMENPLDFSGIKKESEEFIKKQKNVLNKLNSSNELIGKTETQNNLPLPQTVTDNRRIKTADDEQE